MNKILLWAVIFIVILVVSTVGLNFLANIKLKKTYTDYYSLACSQQGIDNPFTHPDYGTRAVLCSDTEGCFYACGSCIPKQKLSIFKTFSFFAKEKCTESCIPQCVCEYGKEFEEQNGCVK